MGGGIRKRTPRLAATGRASALACTSQPTYTGLMKPGATFDSARGRLGADQVLEALGRLARRDTSTPDWITLGVTLVGELRRQPREQEQQR